MSMTEHDEGNVPQAAPDATALPVNPDDDVLNMEMHPLGSDTIPDADFPQTHERGPQTPDELPIPHEQSSQVEIDDGSGDSA